MKGSTKIRLTMQDGREVDFEGHYCSPADQIQFERRYNMSAQEIGGANYRREWVYFLVFRLAARSVEEFAEIAFDDFMELLADFEFVGEESTPGVPPMEESNAVPPTEPEAPTE